MANIIKFGSLCLDGFPVNVGTEYKPGQAIKIGETTPGKEISWVVVNNLLIADHSILTGISWDDLNANGLVFGKEISAGGFRFTERLLRVEKDGGMPNEWDAALDATGDDDAIWHWQGIYFWGQEAAKRSIAPHSARISLCPFQGPRCGKSGHEWLPPCHGPPNLQHSGQCPRRGEAELWGWPEHRVRPPGGDQPL